MMKCHALITLAQGDGRFIDGGVFGRRRNAGTEMAARALRIGGKSFFTVMAGAAVLPLV